ncbi:hypothetical protein AMTR_s00005p00269130 [Amborella trichopoda]|uniref:Uncharacterized protein n=1 Tax=Amborella trichopoda TaxID=13333 RepID=W1PH66_AMBTC|nr:hypothetical protein AMTR_s00005p00269130 [Amborella trichopoda]
MPASKHLAKEARPLPYLKPTGGAHPPQLSDRGRVETEEERRQGRRGGKKRCTIMIMVIGVMNWGLGLRGIRVQG